MPNIHGRIRDAQTQQGLPGLQVEAFYRLNGEQVILNQTTISGNDGTFIFEFSDDLFATLSSDDVIAVFFQVYRSGEPLTARGNIPVLHPASFQITLTVEVPDEGGDRAIVKGRVTYANGQPAAGLLLHAVLQKVGRPEEAVGEAQTDIGGTYSISYERGEPQCTGLRVRALDANGQELAISRLVVNPGAVEVVDLTLRETSYRDPSSEYDRYRKAAAVCLEDDSWDNLTDQDLQILTETTAVPLDHLRYLRLDAQWSSQHDVDSAIFYGLLRQGLPTNYRRLLAEKSSRLREALKAALEQHLIPSSMEDNLDDNLKRLEELAVEVAFEEDEDAATQPVGLWLRTAALTEDRQKQFVRFALRHDREADFWDKLREEGDFDDEEVDAAQFTLEGGAFVLGHLPTLTAIQERRQDNGWTSTRDLARLTRSDWQALVRETTTDGLPDGFDDSDGYARSVAHRIEQVMPTAVFAHRLEADNELGSSDLNYFLSANTGFDLIHTQVRDFLSNGADLEQVNDTDGLRLKLEQFQRVGRLARGSIREMERIKKEVPDLGIYEIMRPLITAGFDSCLKIAATGQASFAQTMAATIDSEMTGQLFGEAQGRAWVVQIIQQIGHDYTDQTLTPVLPHVELDAGESPTWAGMFGTTNGCECEHCRSVYGPAAYMADLLLFLRDAPASAPLLNILFARRPDLQYILLNCPNATTPLPYIDLVNEILEEAIAPVDPVPAPVEGASPAEHEAYERWRARYQTPAPNGETQKEIERRLRAEPEHERADAYTILKAETYPWLLPFSLSHEKAQRFAEHLGVSLHEIRRLFGHSRQRLAQTHLGLSDAAWELISEADTTPETLREKWGLAPPEDLEVLNAVPRFLAQAGLSYEELEDLVGSDFLPQNNEPRIEINRGADPCDITDDRLVGLSADTLDRIHRFLRLRRALGWSIEDLNAVLQSIGATDIDRETLGQLSQWMQLADAYRLSANDAITLYKSSDNRALLAEKLRLHDAELRLLETVTGENPFGSPAASQRFIEKWETLKISGFNSQELAYILLHQDQVPAAVAPTPESLEDFLRALHGFVQEQSGEVRMGDADLARLLLENLAQYLQLEIDVVPTLVVDTVDEGGATRPAVLRADRDRAEAALVDFMDFARVPAPVEPGDPDIASTPAFNHARRLLIRLDKTARILRQLEITRRELEAIQNVRAENGFLDFNNLPFDESEAASLTPPEIQDRYQARYIAWQQLVEAKRLQRELPRADWDLFDLLHYATGAGAYIDLSDPGAFDELKKSTGWNSDDLVKLADALSLTAPEDFQRIDTYRKLSQAIRRLRRWSIDADTLLRWSDPASSAADLATSLENTAHERYTDDNRWYEVLTPIMDELREKKRDALLAHLIVNSIQIPVGGADEPAWTDTNGIYAHYLIDVEMSSCMLSSRIKQANASIQLFVQRVMMNLENDVFLTDPDAEYWNRWAWMKNYRVWEANRKVFLYPENWIEPDLRDDKSPFFRDAETALLQDEINSASVERVVRQYLERLDEVGRLEVLGFHRELDDREPGFGRKRLHVIARTHSEPHIYYYRRRDMISKVWTAWKRIDLNIDGKNLLPVVYNSHLLLFWATFNETGKNLTSLLLHWSQHRDGVWTPAQTENAKGSYSMGPEIDLHSLFLKSSTRNNELAVDVYHSWGPIRNHWVGVSSAYFRFNACGGSLKLYRSRRPEGLSVLKLFIFPTRTITYETKAIESVPSEPAFITDTGPTPLIYADPGYSEGEIELPYDLLETSPSFDDPTRLSLAVLLLNIGDDAPLKRTIDLASGKSKEVLHNTPGQFQLVLPSQPQSDQPSEDLPFFFVDEEHSYLVTLGIKPDRLRLDGIVKREFNPINFTFEPFYHSYVCEFTKAVQRKGIQGLLAPGQGYPLDRQQDTLPRSFASFYMAPETHTVGPDPLESIDFSVTGSQSVYNWELFFHIPLLVADRLSKNQRFEEAQKWFHYIFDPTDISKHPPRAKYWKVKPFFEEAQNPPETIRELMRKLAAGDEEMGAQVRAWRDNPFNPHLIARLRTLAYMKTVVMKYLDNLIAWGDHLFQQDTIESINEATQLYVLAAEILGKPPVPIRRENPEDLNFADLRNRLGEFANALIDLETMLPADLGSLGRSSSSLPPNLILYFCIPSNQKLDSYRHTIADRLFKIRHCMNIAGQERQLRLFEPPIDPALLVRARAAGLDLRQALSQIGTASLPHYRYPYLHQKALELCNEVRSLGNALLSALEKKDAEDLALLRTRHEISLLSQVRLIKDQQIKEAEETRDSLINARKLAEERLAFYSSREYRNAGEQSQIDHLHTARVFEIISQGMKSGTPALYLFPDVSVGLGTVETKFGGMHLGSAVNAAADAVGIFASQYSFEASLSSMTGAHDRRRDDWNLQVTLAEKELDQIDKQIAAAEIRLTIAEQDLVNHEKQIEQAREVEDFLRRKFTNQELYSWMVGQVSALHYHAYRMAVDLARKVETAARHDLGVTETEFNHIQPDNWDSQRKGLLAGERLHQQLRRMDVAYLEQNRRDYEITKHVSLAMLDPRQLILLRETGACEIHIPEVLFDLDFPGQFRRRIKSVSLSLPCVTGPHTSVSCKLTMNSSRIRWTDVPPAPAERLDVIPGGSAVATSSGQGDSGLFELNFRDERYLPFEGAGAISSWTLELPAEFQAFDYDTISDVILHMQYTARDGRTTYKQAVETEIRAKINAWLNELAGSSTPIARAFSLRHDFPSEFHRFLHPPSDAPAHSLELKLESRHFPHFLSQRELKVSEAYVIVKPKLGASLPPVTDWEGQTIDFGKTETSMPGTLHVVTTEINPNWWNELPAAPVSGLSGPLLETWKLEIDASGYPASLTRTADGGISRLNPDLIEDVMLVFAYQVEPLPLPS